MSNDSASMKSLLVSLLGSQANITVPAEKDKMNLGLMFAQLDSTVRELREENKQLR